MYKLLLVVCWASLVLSKPADVHLDKVTIHDVSANTVAPEKKLEGVVEQADKVAKVEITGITTGVEGQTPFRPQRAGSMFARLIDDIFQIPISVLQNVAKLITNPFTQSKVEATAEAKGH